MVQREIKHNFNKSIKAASNQAANLEKGVYAARRYGVTKMQQRAMKEINRLQEEGWELPQSTINRAKSNQQRISAKQYEVYKDLLSISHIRKQAYRTVEFNVKVGDVKYNDKYPGLLDLNHGKIENVRSVKKTMKISYNDPGKALRKAIMGTMKYGKRKSEAVNEIASILSSIGIMGNDPDIFRGRQFEDDFITNFRKYVPTARELNRAIKNAETVMGTGIYGTVSQEIEVLHRAYGTSIEEAAALWHSDREAIDAVFLRNHKGYDVKNLESFKKLWEYLPSFAWTRYRSLYDSDDWLSYYDEMLKYDPDNYDMEEVIDDFAAGVLREDTPEEIHDTALNNAKRAKVFNEKQK